MSDKQYKTEWSFSFEKLGDRLNEMLSSFGGSTEIQMASYSEPVDGATSAEVDLRFSLGQMNIQPLVASDNLFEADVNYIGEMEFTVEGDAHKTLVLGQVNKNPVTNTVKQAIGSIGKHHDLRWDVRLSPDVLLALKLSSGLGKNTCDLSGLNLTSFEFNGGTGETMISLPPSDIGYAATFREGVGETRIDLPEHTTLDVEIKSGVGEVKVHVPGSAAVRVHVKNGIGDATIPRHFVKLEEKGEFVSTNGIWETPGFDEAEHQITIDYNGGIGSFSIITDVAVV